MDSTKLGQIHADKAEKALLQRRHEELLAIQAKTSDTVLAAVSSLIQYLEGHTTKAEVVNQLEEIKTPDVHYVVEALQVLDATLKTHENTDLTGVTALMQELLNQARQLPKTLPDAPEIPQPIDYGKQLDGLKEAIRAVEKVVKEQKLVAEAPIVNVPETTVHVDKPDLEPLQDGFRDVVKAVQKIIIPEFKTDNAAVEKLLKESNKYLRDLLDKPVGAGGGGGGYMAVDSDDNPVPLKRTDFGGIQIADQIVTERYDYSSATTIYTAIGALGASDAATGWQITKYDLSSSSAASGKIATDVSWNNRASGSYN